MQTYQNKKSILSAHIPPKYDVRYSLYVRITLIV
jgi:hypothetical protein